MKATISKVKNTTSIKKGPSVKKEIIIGIFAVVITVLIFKSLRKMGTHRILKKGSWIRFWEPKEYVIVEGSDYEGSEFMKFVHIVALAAAYGMTYAIMFG